MEEKEKEEPDYKIFTVRLDKKLKERLQKYAQENDLEMTQVVRKAIRKLISKHL